LKAEKRKLFERYLYEFKEYEQKRKKRNACKSHKTSSEYFYARNSNACSEHRRIHVACGSDCPLRKAEAEAAAKRTPLTEQEQLEADIIKFLSELAALREV
jgi:hypothetical protein